MRKALIACLLTAATAACTSEAYDSGDTGLSYLSTELADATTNSNGLFAHAVTDGGQRLTLSPPYRAEHITTTPDTTCRVLMYHGRVDGGTTDVKAIQSVLTTSIVNRRDDISPKKDPVGKVRAWVSANKKYLNMVVTLKVGQQDGAPTQQSVGLLRDSVTTLADGKRCHWISLIHNQNGMPEYYSQEAYMSVPMSQLGDDAHIRLRAKTYDGESLLEVR